MKLGRYTLNKDSIRNRIISGLRGLNSKAYWDSRFKHDWSAAGGRVQTMLFALGIERVLAEHRELHGQVNSIIDYGAACGDSAPVLKFFFEHASIALWDFAPAAQGHATKHYSELATILTEKPVESFDLVYCSNVIEHIDELDGFLEELVKVAGKFLIIQAPYNQQHADQTDLSNQNPIGEHVRTVSDRFVDEHLALCEFQWSKVVCSIPYAWKEGRQVIFVGKRR